MRDQLYVITRCKQGKGQELICENLIFDPLLWTSYAIWEILYIMCSVMMLFMHLLECYFGVDFACVFTIWELNTKITLVST